MIDTFQGKSAENQLPINPIELSILILIGILSNALPILMHLLTQYSDNCKFDFEVVFELATTVKDYIFYSPTYIHLFILYAFCRIDDLTWGTKGLDADS